MRRMEKFWILTISGIMALAFLLIWAPVGAENPPPGTRFMGPTMIVDFLFTPADGTEDGTCVAGSLLFEAEEVRCQGQTYTWDQQISCCDDVYSDVNEDSLNKLFRSCVEETVYADCAPEGVTIDGLFNQAVLSYEVDTTLQEKRARIIMLFVVPQGKPGE